MSKEFLTRVQKINEVIGEVFNIEELKNRMQDNEDFNKLIKLRCFNEYLEYMFIIDKMSIYDSSHEYEIRDILLIDLELKYNEETKV